MNDFGCLMARVNVPVWDKLVRKLVNENDLYIDPTDDSYGYEDEPHATVLYGFHDNTDIQKVIVKVCEFPEPIELFINDISIFEGKDKPYDVVKFGCSSDSLTKLNKIMRDNFDYTSSFPDYKVHITMAYVKRGMGQKYVHGLTNRVKATIQVMIYSDAENNKTTWAVEPR